MVVGVPVVKLAPLVLKTITKPFVDSLKRNVKKSSFWKFSVFIPLAEYYNKQSVRMRLWTQGIRRNKEQVEKSAHMSEDAALELGAEIVANSVTFIIALVAIVMQQYISAATEKKKEKAEENQLKRIETNQLELHRKVVELGLRVHEQDAKLRELTRTIAAMPGYGARSSQKQND